MWRHLCNQIYVIKSVKEKCKLVTEKLKSVNLVSPRQFEKLENSGRKKLEMYKKVILENFVVFYPDVKTYLYLCSPSTQFEIAHFPDIHVPLFAFKLKWKIFL